MLNTKVVAWSLALFGAVTFLGCVLYGLLAPSPLLSFEGPDGYARAGGIASLMSGLA